MKKLINDPRDAMQESLAGFAEAHADILKVSFHPVYVVRADAAVTGKVGVISGGGSGHEPMLGQRAQARSPILPGSPGQVAIHGELWQAESTDRGRRVRPRHRRQRPHVDGHT